MKANPGENKRAVCYLVMRVKGGKFVREAPAEPGTFTCDPKQEVKLTGDYGTGAKASTK